MTLNTFTSGVNTSFSTELNQNQASSLKASGRNLIRQLQDRSVTLDIGEFAEAYIDSTGRLDSVIGAGAAFNTDKYEADTTTDNPFVIIEATSISSATDFEINDCQIVEVASGKFQVSCTSGTLAERRAKIYKTLFYGTNGSNPRASATYITGITALKTSISRDVGKQAHSAIYSWSTSSFGSGSYTGTFVNTTTNTDCSTWSYVYQTQNGDFTGWELPDDTQLNTISTITTSDETGTDTEADETDNPATCQLYINSASNSSASRIVRSIILCVGDITWATSGSATSRTNIDFLSDNSIPVMTATTETFQNTVVHSIPSGTFSSTISSAFMTALVEDWEAGANIQFKLTNGTDDTGWLDYNEIQTFTAFASEPDELQVKLVPKSTSPTAGYPSINGVAVYE